MSIVGDIYGIMGVLSASQQIGMNALAPAIREFLQGNPEAVIDPHTAARLMVRGYLDAPTAYTIGAQGGYGSEQFSDLIADSVAPVPLAQAFDLYHRGLIDQSELQTQIERTGIDPLMQQQILGLGEVLLPPAILADAVLRGWMTEADGQTEAAKQGITPERFSIMLDDTGEPPGLMQLLEAYRRGIIDKPTLEHGIKESRVRDEWIPTVEALKYQPPSAAEAIDAAVKGHLDMQTAQEMAAVAGLDPANFDWRYKATGNPPGAGELVDLWRRGLVDEQHVIDALKQGHLADAYIPDILALRRKLLSGSELLMAQQTGNITGHEVIAGLLDLGYSESDAAILAATGSRAKIAADWQLAKQIVVDQYQIGSISKADAATYLTTIGYDQHEADSILAVADLARALQAQNAAISKIKSRFIAYKIDAVQAQNSLVDLQVPAEQVTTIITEWELAREANTPLLTPAQIADALHYTIIDQATAQAELERLGYSPQDAYIMLSVRAHAPLPNPPQ
jgi:hypothetical protein